MSNRQQITKHYDRTELDFGVYSYDCKHCGHQFDPDESMMRLWFHIHDFHQAKLGDWAKPNQ